jgi:glycosyltransferase involved in cell wall biosynthesis
MRIGAIASMKQGLEHFIYRELSLFTALGCAVSLFPTKYRTGLYGPRDEWRVCRWTVPRVLLWQPCAFLRRPARYAALFWEALRTRAVVECWLAWYFASRMREVDVVYATFGDRKLFIGYFCKRILGKPLAVTLHAYELYRNPNPRLFARALAACDRIVTVSQHNRELLQSRHGIDPARVEVVRYSLDLEEYRPAQKFVLLIVGFFVERKGHRVLFEALKRLGRDDVEVWVVGGEGVEGAGVDVRDLAREIGVERQVAFFGTLHGAALRAVYRACDVFCLPCHTDSQGVAEGFPNVLIEAMALGKPVITTRHVEIPRVIPEILVDERDVDGLARAIERVYRSGALRQRLGIESRRIAETHFSPRNAARTVALLRELAHAARGVAGTAAGASENAVAPAAAGAWEP